MLIFLFTATTCLSLLLLVVQTLLSMNSSLMETQLASLEAGFESMISIKFTSISFFSLAVLFVLFDVELILLLPLVFNILLSKETLVSLIIIALTLLFTLLLEWSWWGLKWQT